MHLDRSSGHLWLTPSDVTTYLGSRWVFAQALAVARGERERWSEPENSTAEITRRRGDEHEKAYLAALKAGGKKIIEIPRAKPSEQWQESIAATSAAIADRSVDVVFQAHFSLEDKWRGQADFLERNEQGVFEPVDTKLARSVKPYMVHQLAFYAEALAEVQGSTPLRFHAVLGDGRRETLATNDFIHVARQTRRAVEEFVSAGAAADEYPWPSEQIELAGLAEEAETIWRADDHPLLIAGVGRKQIEKLASVGIATGSALAKAEGSPAPQGIAGRTWEKITRQARLQKTEPPTWELLRPEERRGLALLKKPSAGDIFYDIEGDPLWDAAGSLEYLHGLWWIDPETDQEVFNPLWAHDREQERQAFEKLMEIFIARRTAYPDMRIYHYAPYETIALKRLASTYGTCEEELDDLLRGEVFIDLFQVVRQSLQASVENYSIKSMERFYMEAREASVKEGGASIVEYERYRDIAGSEEGEAILDSIELYNEEDCRSTYLLREWLRKRHRDAVKEFGWVSEPEPWRESEDKGNASPMSGAPSKGELHKNNLLLARAKLELAADKEADPDRQHALRLLSEVLFFHTREDRTIWWSYFAHQEMTVEELIADGEAIGGLTLLDVEHERPEVRTFAFPAQDYKARPGDTLRDPQHDWNAGTLIEIDDKSETITIKLGPDARGRPPEAVFPHKYIDKIPIDRALIDLADSLVEGREDEFFVARRVLTREKPLFGEELAGGDLKALREQLIELEGSYMVAQGPPGTGKTHTAADLIVDQLIRGKRVGVTAGTHMAVDNLCRKVEELARDRGHVFTGVKKDGDSTYESELGYIYSVSDNEAAAPGVADLTAGTPWLFSRPEWHEQLDLIVIDEAGQFSLAAALAVATSASTVLMVGDPNQLPQVVKGSHPPGAGASALEHAIGENRTIPRDMGVFLPESRRMTPELCAFVSDTFYDGRLSPHECVEGLEPPGAALTWIAARHTGNRQRSPEEAAAIAARIDELSREGISPGDVMVVAPYNMQVDLLRREIDASVPGGEEVRVLTVDKCQGQQAEVVFYSLATSGGEEVPRGLDFLFSANRFNVAISRARRAAYLVCSPELLAVDAKSVRDMRLADAFLAFVERAQLLSSRAISPIKS